MTAPVRLRFERKKRFNLEALSRARNGLSAKLVARPSRCGNPHDWQALGRPVVVGRDRCETVPTLDLRPNTNLACYCPLNGPCHVAVRLWSLIRPPCAISPATGVFSSGLRSAPVF